MRKTTANLDAYDYYLRGLGTFVRAMFESDNEVNIEARKMYEKAIELDPQYALAYQGLSRTYWLEWFIQVNRNASQSLEHAFSLAQQAIALDNTLPSAHSILGVVAIWKKRHEQALREGERAVARDPNFADGFVNFAQSLVFVGRPQEALSLVEQAMRLNPRYPARYLFTLGVVYRELGRYQEAITIVKKFLALNPRYPHVRYHLAICYAKLGQEEEAHTEVAELLKLQPHVSLEAFRKFIPYKDPAAIEQHIAALRKAGLK